jgi:diguanylate cyclase (GGDEF)-like protein
MLEMAAAALAQGMMAKGCVIHVLDEDGTLIQSGVYGKITHKEDISTLADLLSHESEAIAREMSDTYCLCIATRYRGHVNGIILIQRDKQASSWHYDDHKLLNAVEPQMGIALRQIRDQRRLEFLSRTDELTGLLNRRAFIGDLEPALERARRTSTPCALLYLDLDNFKPVNDTLGHDAGDEVLVILSGILKSCTRKYDLVARLGGDEFALWLESTTPEIAKQRADDLMVAGAVLKEKSASPDLTLSFSIGIALFSPNDYPKDMTVTFIMDDLIAKADHAMYAVKKAGKQGVSLYQGEET